MVPRKFQAETCGGGLWSNTKKTFNAWFDKCDFTLFESEGNFWGTLYVHFDPRDWDVQSIGMIYTDPLFLEKVKIELKAAGLKNYEGINYSEQGKQGDDYVDFDVGSDLVKEIKELGIAAVEEI